MTGTCTFTGKPACSGPEKILRLFSRLAEDEIYPLTVQNLLTAENRTSIVSIAHSTDAQTPTCIESDPICSILAATAAASKARDSSEISLNAETDVKDNYLRSTIE